MLGIGDLPFSGYCTPPPDVAAFPDPGVYLLPGEDVAPWYNPPMPEARGASYPVPAAEVRREIVVVNSRFIAAIAPAETVEEARSFIARIRAAYPDATHHVPAYIVGGGSSAVAHTSDDGEPSGSAGRPVLSVLRGSGLGDVVLVVTRYFGGTKLGIGGLVRAYTQAAQEAVAAVPRARKVRCHTVMVGLPYGWLERVRRLVAQHGGVVLDEDFAAEVTLTACFAVEDFPAFQATLREASAGRLEALVLETALVRLPVEAHRAE